MIFSQLKSLIFFLLILLVILMAVDTSSNFGVKHDFQNDLGKVNLVMGHRVDPDIMIFGSSNSEVGFDVPLLRRLSGKSVYNAALDGTHFLQMGCLVSEFSDYSSQNKYVILGLSPFSLGPMKKVNRIDQFLAYIDNPYVYKSLSSMDPNLTNRCRFIPFYKYTEVNSDYYKQVMIGWKSYLGSARQKEISDTNYGFTPNFQQWQKDQDAVNAASDRFPIPIDSSVCRYLQGLITTLQAKGKKVILIYPPVQKDGQALITNFDAIGQAIKDLGARADYYFDFSNCSISAKKEFFYNDSHLNARGAKEFSLMLFNQMKGVLN